MSVSVRRVVGIYETLGLVRRSTVSALESRRAFEIGALVGAWMDLVECSDDAAAAYWAARALETVAEGLGIDLPEELRRAEKLMEKGEADERTINAMG